MNKKKIWPLIILLVLVVLVSGTVTFYKWHAKQGPYERGMALYDAGRYEEAFETLLYEGDLDYRDTFYMICLCESRAAFEKGDVAEAYSALPDSPYFRDFSAQPAARRAEIEAYLRELDEAYALYLTLSAGTADPEETPWPEPEETAGPEETAQAAEEEAPAGEDDGRENAQAVIASGIPVGTTDASGASGDGEEENTPEPEETAAPSGSGTGWSFPDDDFPVEDFATPEDFSEWYYDDFDDFEEAEDYYYEHGGW